MSTKQLAAVLIAASVVSAGIGAGVAVVTLGVSPIAPGTGTLAGSNVLTIQSQELQYTGNDVTAVNVTINNTDTSPHTVDIHLALRNTTAGTVVQSQTITGVTVPAGSTNTVQITLSPSVSVTEFDQIEVNVEQTG